ncbi:ExbD/TolR family protein [Lysobacter fragariae]
MAFSSDSGGGGGRPMAEINVTPLVDVMLVLLIIFMITAPLMTHKVKVDLPEANLDKRDPTKVQLVTPITIAIEDTGALYWNDEPINKGVLESRFSIEAQKDPQAQVNVRGDKTAKYKLVQEIVTIAQNQGMRKVGFVAIKDRRGQ